MPLESHLNALDEELATAGVSLDEPANRDGLLEAAAFVLQPEVHEGKIVPTGFVNASPLRVPNGATLVGADQVSIDSAKRMADGSSTFLALDSGRYCGVLVLRSPCMDEYALVRLRKSSGGLVGVTDASGTSKFFGANGIAIHEFRRWRKKPTLKHAVNLLLRHAPSIKIASVRKILSFCHYLLSPRRIGATLVWYCESPSTEALLNARGLTPLEPYSMNIVSGTNTHTFKSLLERFDGAALLDADGSVRGIGAHLSASERAAQCVRQMDGTRHTSAKRYSYDFSESIVFTVSADGPVTVFSEGARITELQLQDTTSQTLLLQSIAPDRDDIESDEWEEKCEVCGKTSLLGDILIPGWREMESAHCEVCGNVMLKRMTFQLFSRVLKKRNAIKPG